MRDCPNCEKAVAPFVQLEPVGGVMGFVSRCPTCQFVFRDEAPAAEPVALPEATRRAAVAANHVTIADDEVDIVALIQRRVRELRATIAAADRLRPELARYELMLEAASAGNESTDTHPEH